MDEELKEGGAHVSQVFHG